MAFPVLTVALAILCLVPTLLLVACGVGPDKPVGSPTAGLTCLDDSPGCIAKRQATLQHYTSSPDRSWIRQRPDAAAYASGVRLFAYKRQKSRLSCAELASGIAEADAAPRTLEAASSRLTPAQLSRGKMLANEVSSELKRERRRRCKG